MIEIVNLRKTDLDRKQIQYVGRGSVLGNRFKIGINGNREQVIQKYRRWLWNRICDHDQRVTEELDRLKEIAKKGDLVLGCWCAPKRCHAEIIKNAINWIINK